MHSFEMRPDGVVYKDRSLAWQGKPMTDNDSESEPGMPYDGLYDQEDDDDIEPGMPE